jgi:hypothetical protein
MENAASKEFAVELPETGDGYYRCTITAVASKKAASSETESTFYWRVADGIQEPLEFSQWQNEAPLANQARAL